MEKIKVSKLKAKSSNNSSNNNSSNNSDKFDRFRSKLKSLQRSTLRSLSNPRSSTRKSSKNRKMSNQEHYNSSNSSSESVSPARFIRTISRNENDDSSRKESFELDKIEMNKLRIEPETKVIMRPKNPSQSSSKTSSNDIFFTCQTSFSFFQGASVLNSRDSISSLTSVSSYEFSSLDKDTISSYGLQVRPINQLCVDDQILNDGQRNSCIIFDQFQKQLQRYQWNVDQLIVMSDIFNQNDFGLTTELKKSPNDASFLLGTVRIYMNLLRPIRMELSSRPSSIFDIIGGGSHSTNSDEGSTYLSQDQSPLSLATIEPIWLPRGTSKRLFVTESTPTSEVIRGILNKFHIRVDYTKFGLYEHIIQDDTKLLVRKLNANECPLATMLSWTERGASFFNEQLAVRRLVLQENETGDINWSSFSRPELDNFIKILAREELEARQRLELKYSVLRKEIHRIMSNHNTASSVVVQS